MEHKNQPVTKDDSAEQPDSERSLLEASVFRMRLDVPHYAFRRFLSPLSSHCFF